MAVEDSSYPVVDAQSEGESDKANKQVVQSDYISEIVPKNPSHPDGVAEENVECSELRWLEVEEILRSGCERNPGRSLKCNLTMGEFGIASSYEPKMGSHICAYAFKSYED